MTTACEASKKMLAVNPAITTVTSEHDKLVNELDRDSALSMAKSLKDQYERYEALHPEIKEAEKVG